MFGSSQVVPDKVAIYIRWSTDEQTQGTTLEVQRDACKHFVLSQGWAYREDMVFVDEGYSGASLDRPAITALRKAVARGDVAAVVVYKLDRLSRNLLDCVTLVRREWASTALFSTTEHFDTHSPLGQMVFNLLVSFAEFERNVIRERTMSGKRKRLEQGRNSGFPYPYGYRKSAEGGFEIDPEQAIVVERMFREYVNGTGLAGVVDSLNRDGIPAPKGGKWRVCTVSLILRNPFYAGHYAPGHARTQAEKKRRPAAEVYIQNALPAIISQELFDSAQDVRKERIHPGWPVRKDSDYILSTVLKCARCGGPMVGHANQDGRRYYRCCNAKDFRTCDNGGVPKDEVEQRVLVEVRQAYSPSHLMAQLGRLQVAQKLEIARCKRAVAVCEAKVREFKPRRERLDADYLAGVIDGTMYGRLVERLEEEGRSLGRELQVAERELRMVQHLPVEQERLAELAAQIDGLLELSPDQVREVLRSLFASVTAYRAKKRGRWNPEPVELTFEHNVKALALV